MTSQHLFFIVAESETIEANKSSDNINLKDTQRYSLEEEILTWGKDTRLRNKYSLEEDIGVSYKLMQIN